MSYAQSQWGIAYGQCNANDALISTQNIHQQTFEQLWENRYVTFQYTTPANFIFNCHLYFIGTCLKINENTFKRALLPEGSTPMTSLPRNLFNALGDYMFDIKKRSGINLTSGLDAFSKNPSIDFDNITSFAKNVTCSTGNGIEDKKFVPQSDGQPISPEAKQRNPWNEDNTISPRDAQPHYRPVPNMDNLVDEPINQNIWDRFLEGLKDAWKAMGDLEWDVELQLKISIAGLLLAILGLTIASILGSGGLAAPAAPLAALVLAGMSIVLLLQQHGVPVDKNKLVPFTMLSISDVSQIASRDQENHPYHVLTYNVEQDASGNRTIYTLAFGPYHVQMMFAQNKALTINVSKDDDVVTSDDLQPNCKSSSLKVHQDNVQMQSSPNQPATSSIDTYVKTSLKWGNCSKN